MPPTSPSTSASAKWTAADLPDLGGKNVVVTGANSGLGLETTRELARAGARIVMACRDAAKAETALADVRQVRPDAEVEVRALDLSSLASVREFAKQVEGDFERLDLLINNAGVMALPRRETADGFEMQLGTNHLGHFALTGLLLDRLLASDSSRVVNLSSTAHRMGQMRFDDLHGEKSYGAWSAYGQSKLANLLFTFELGRRLDASQAGCLAVASHPGYAATNLQFAGPRMESSSWKEIGMGLMNRLFSQTASMGALPTLYAATAPDVRAGDYIGPDGIGEAWGHPTKVGSSSRARDEDSAARLWHLSEELTGVAYLS